MKSGIGRFGLVFLALTLCLAGTGAAFAKWCDSVEVVGVVNTGEVKIGLWDADVLDIGPDPQALDTEWNFDNSENKDVASHNSTNEGRVVCTKTNVIAPPNWEELGRGPGPFASADFVTRVVETVNNAYPGYRSGSWVYIGNCGTIPVKIEDIDLEVIRDNKGLAPFLRLGSYRVWSFTGPQDNRQFEEITDDSAVIIDDLLNGLQLEPCEYAILYFEFWFAEELDDGTIMPQNASMAAEITVEACQWNESKWNAP